MRIKGDIRSGEDLTIWGRVEGTVEVGYASVGETSGATGRSLSARGKLTVVGAISGSIKAHEVEARSGSILSGDVVTSRMTIEAGAVVNARIETVLDDSPATATDMPPRTRSARAGE